MVLIVYNTQTYRYILGRIRSWGTDVQVHIIVPFLAYFTRNNFTLNQFHKSTKRIVFIDYWMFEIYQLELNSLHMILIKEINCDLAEHKQIYLSYNIYYFICNTTSLISWQIHKFSRTN